MKENTTTISNIINVPIGSIAKYEVNELYFLCHQISEQLEQLKRTKEWVESAIALKYEEQIKAKRLRLEKDAGIVHLEDGSFKLISDIPKKVIWDQEKLARIIKDIEASNANPAEYIETSHKILESKYNGWSEAMRNIFLPARTIKLGKPIYKLTKLNDEVVL